MVVLFRCVKFVDCIVDSGGSFDVVISGFFMGVLFLGWLLLWCFGLCIGGWFVLVWWWWFVFGCL